MSQATKYPIQFYFFPPDVHYLKNDAFYGYAEIRYCSALLDGIRHEAKCVRIPILYGDTVMAKARRDFGVEFVNLRLSTKDKKDVDAWVKQQEYTTADFIEALMLQEYKVSMSHDPDNACYIVAVTGKQGHPINSAKCLTSRAATIDDAIWLTAYKHMVICEEGNWGESDSTINAYG